MNGTVWTILPRGGVVYVGGEFTRFCGQSRNFAAAFNEASGLPTPWNPSADAQVEVIVPSMTALFLGGAFKEIGGSARPMLAEVDTISGATTSWSTDTGDPNEVFRPEVTALAVRDSVLFASGAFAHLGGQPRAGVAALELRSGRATPWVANTDGFVLSFAVAESTVFLGGSFSVVNGVPRSNLAAVSVATGAPLAWRADAGDPLHAHGPVYALALTDSTLYVGGAGPTSFDGSSTSSVAAIDIRTGATRDWAVPMDYSFISTMSVVGRELDVGGYFRRAGVWRAAGVATISCWSDPGSSRSAAALELAQSWPNPARDAATIAFQLSADAYATLELFDLQGRCVRRVLRAQRLEAGNHTVQVPTGALKTGCYFYRLTVGDLRAARRLVVVH